MWSVAVAASAARQQQPQQQQPITAAAAAAATPGGAPPGGASANHRSVKSEVTCSCARPCVRLGVVPWCCATPTGQTVGDSALAAEVA